MRYMYCPKCGALNNAQGGRCTSCGYDFGLIPDHIKERNTSSTESENAQNTEYSEYSAENIGKTEAAETTESIDGAKTPENVAGAGTETAYNGFGESERSAAVGTAAAAQGETAKKSIQTYMIRAILLTVFGSIAFGIVSIIFSGMTQTELAAGSVGKAREYSEKTRMFCWISLFIGIAKYICIALFFLLYLAF